MVWETGPPPVVMALWDNPTEPQSVLTALVNASREQGWAGSPGPAAEVLPPQFISLSRDHARRMIAFVSAQGHSMLTVSDSDLP